MHAFCPSCLRTWFKTRLHDELALYHDVPDEWFSDRLTSVQVRDVKQFLACRYMPYTCPMCRVNVKEKPTVVYALNALIEVLTRAVGPPGEDEVAITANDEDFWVGSF